MLYSDPHGPHARAHMIYVPGNAASPSHCDIVFMLRKDFNPHIWSGLCTDKVESIVRDKPMYGQQSDDLLGTPAAGPCTMEFDNNEVSPQPNERVWTIRLKDGLEKWKYDNVIERVEWLVRCDFSQQRLKKSIRPHVVSSPPYQGMCSYCHITLVFPESESSKALSEIYDALTTTLGVESVRRMSGSEYLKLQDRRRKSKITES